MENKSTMHNMNSVLDKTRQRKTKINDNINEKIREFCKNNLMGELSYQRLSIEMDGLYRELDIINKKKITCSLVNTCVIMHRGNGGGYIGLVLDTNENINKTLLDYDITNRNIVILQMPKYNKIFDRHNYIIRFYVNNEELDLSKINLTVFKRFINNKIIMYAIRNGVSIPNVNFESSYDTYEVLGKLEKLLNPEELLAINIM